MKKNNQDIITGNLELQKDIQKLRTVKCEPKKQEIVSGKYEPKKNNNLKMMKFIRGHVTHKHLLLIRKCSTFMKFISETAEDMSSKKLVLCDSCRNRFCSICAWRKSRKDSFKIGTLLEVIRLEEKKEFIFLTLTTPNIKSYDVNDMIKHFNKSFELLMKRKQVKAVVKGYIRKLEMTYNEERNDYNPHFHVLLAVNKSYFTDTKQYINHKTWLNLWREATGMDEITQVDVRKVNMLRGSAVDEIAKYSAKDIDILHSKPVFDTFYKSLKGKRLLSYSGLFKEYSKKFDNGELDKYLEHDETDYFFLLTTTWDWTEGKYVKAYRKLTDKEKEEFKKPYEQQEHFSLD